jgi:hypothetical protein
MHGEPRCGRLDPGDEEGGLTMRTAILLVGLMALGGCSAQVTDQAPESFASGSTSCTRTAPETTGVAARCGGAAVEYACTGPGAGTAPGVVEAPAGCSALDGPAGLYCCAHDVAASAAQAVAVDGGTECPGGFHACSLGTVGYACDDTSWYYCAAGDVACETPEPCVPLPPKTLGLDAGH